MNGTGFAVSSVRTDGDVRVEIAGELDLLTVGRVEAELGRVEASGTSQIVLDLTRITYFDATGLQAILDADERALEATRGFAVLTGAVPLRRVLELLGRGHLLKREAADDRAPRAEADGYEWGSSRGREHPTDRAPRLRSL
jgi:anti-sigma B factor antagonist